MTRRMPLLTGLILIPFLAGCEAEPETEELPAVDTAAEAEMEMGMEEMPDTTAQAVWTHIQDANYAQEWDFWPDKEPYYEGTEPHGALLSTYLNEDASMAVTQGGVTDLPFGSIVVKENYMPDSTLAATTVMYKSEGYAPDAGNWFWAKYGPDGAVQASGHAQACLDCHQEAAEQYDYLMTAMQQGDGGN